MESHWTSTRGWRWMSAIVHLELLLTSNAILFLPVGITKTDLYVMRYLWRTVNNKRVSRLKLCVSLLIITSIFISVWIYYICLEDPNDYLLIARRNEKLIQEQLIFDKGSGCVMPNMDPFGKEAVQADREPARITCNGTSWVKCYLAKCKVINKILYKYIKILCIYRDIVFETDFLYHLGPAVTVLGGHIYHLRRSDHVNVTCTGYEKKSSLFTKWSGNLAGFRSNVTRTVPPEGREHTINVIAIVFDSSARIRFIRRMPQSYKYLVEDLQATVLNSYNIVGDGTKEILTAIFTGRSLYELPNARDKNKNKKVTCDVFPFIFYRLRDDGYRTAFLEDGPDFGTYQWDSNGFQKQPTDHFMTSFNTHNRLHYYDHGCLGDTPQYKLMMDLNLQFMRLDGKKFMFTLLSELSHNDYNLITNADKAFVDFLKAFKRHRLGNNTLLLVMGDHGPRFGVDRTAPQAYLEERLPLMAVALPERLKAERPGAQLALRKNANTLTTPFDIHATLLDVVGLRKYWNNYKVPGADYSRGMTILEPIPATRSCSEAGISPHFCACLAWRAVPHHDRLYKMAVDAFVDYVNFLLQPVKLQCETRSLANIESVKTIQSHSKNPQQIYKVKVTINPGASAFEATLTYLVNEDMFELSEKDITRTSRYGSEPACIVNTHPHLRYYCFCYD